MTDSPRTLLITGSTLGEALARAYAESSDVGHILYTFRSREPEFESTKIQTAQLELTDDGAVEQVISRLDRLDGVINTVGLLHNEAQQPEKSIARLQPENLMRSIEVNTLPTALLAKHSRRLLRKSPASFFAAISAKVGSIDDNRLGGWYSYRASKAALNMILKTLAIEWSFGVPNCSVAALHPGTVSSPLSEPFTKDNDALNSPEESAALLKSVLAGLTPENTGRFWAWDGTELPW